MAFCEVHAKTFKVPEGAGGSAGSDTGAANGPWRLVPGQAVNYKAAFTSAKSKVTHITRPGKLSGGASADVPKYELRAPLLANHGGKVVDTSFTEADYTPKPLAAGFPCLLP